MKWRKEIAFLLPLVVFSYWHVGFSSDFVEYWSAFHVLARGGNPYSPAELHTLQLAEEPYRNVPLMMWNPPWALSILAPLLAPSYLVSLYLFKAAMLGFLLFSIILCRDLVITENQLNRSGVILLTSLPLWFAIRADQLSPLLLLGEMLLLLGFKREKPFIGALGILLLSLKPHLVMALFLALLLFAPFRRMLLISASLVFAASVLLLPLRPDLFDLWLQASSAKELGFGISVWDWRTSSMASAMYSILTPEIAFYSILLGSVVACALAIKSKLLDLPLLVGISLFFAPFLWLFDAVLLIPLILQAGGGSYFAPLLLFQIISILVFFSGANEYHHFWWFTPLIILIAVQGRLSTNCLSSHGEKRRAKFSHELS